MANQKSIAVCSLSPPTKYTHFIELLKEQNNVTVTYLCIQRREIELYDFHQYDCVILIHSIQTGRMSITDVKDARYDYLLTRIDSVLGCNRLAVLVTGLDSSVDLQNMKQMLLKEQQTLSRCSAYVKVCRTLEENELAFIGRMLSGLSISRKPMDTHSATIAKSTPLSKGGTEKKQVTKITATAASLPGRGLELTDGGIDINLIICADGSTSDTLLKTLDEESVMDMMDSKVYKQVSDQWNHVSTRPPSNDPHRSQCAVFIYWTTAPTEFTEDDHEMFQRIIEANKSDLKRKRTTQDELRGETDIDFQSQLLRCIDATSIITVTPCKPFKQSALLAHQREAELDMEFKSKKEARQRIHKLEVSAGVIKQQIGDLEIERGELVASVNLLDQTIQEKKLAKIDIQKEYDEMETKLKDSQIELSSMQRDIGHSNRKSPLGRNDEPQANTMDTDVRILQHFLARNKETFMNIAELAKNAASGQKS